MRKVWQQIFIALAVVIVPVGFAIAMSANSGFGAALVLLGIVVLLVAGIASWVRFGFRRSVVHLVFGLTAMLVIGFALNSYCFSIGYIRGASEDPYELWMDALKPFGGKVYYVGSEGSYSYFRARAIFPGRFKAPTAKLKLPQIFPLGSQKPYAVEHYMVQY